MPLPLRQIWTETGGRLCALALNLPNVLIVLSPAKNKRMNNESYSAISVRIRILRPSVGAWRSLVARFVWDEEAPGSNPGSPTSST